jgi:TatD DNase family protein
MVPLDTHAHIEPDIAPAELDALRACIVAVTRTRADFEIARQRADKSVVWAAGCHPGLTREINAFSGDVFRDAISATPVIGEIGLDGAARTPMDRQLEVLRQILHIASETPRILSIHSYRATRVVLAQLRDFSPRGAVLHWWLGTETETMEAIDLGAYFSVNASQTGRWEALAIVPPDRLMFETDHPFGDRRESGTRRPGHLGSAETALSSRLGMSGDDVRRLAWRNFATLVDDLGMADMFPRAFQVQMLAI